MIRHESRWEEGRAVVCLSCAGASPASHEVQTQRTLAIEIATLLGWNFCGDYEASEHGQLRPYFVPGETLDLAGARALGIQAEDDLFGGVVPAEFVATKVITHPLVGPGAVAPAGWSAAFSEAVRAVTLPGCSTFSLRDALAAGRDLLSQGSVRLKLATGVGGLGQSVVHDAAALESAIGELDAAGAFAQGVVLEPNLAQIITYSVGSVRVGGLATSYYGRQRQTSNNRGVEVYGGSNLVLVRGGFDALLAHPMPPSVRMAVEQARVYQTAALRAFPGMYASRCNYDVARGYDDRGRMYAGVLEQSWRAGGASGAELAALRAFQADPSLQRVRASTIEAYGGALELPAGARIYFDGTDPRVGRLTKYAWVAGYDEEGYEDDA